MRKPSSKAILLGKLFKHHGITLTDAERRSYADYLRCAKDWPAIMEKLENARRFNTPIREVPLEERYLVCEGWPHCFVGSQESIVRFVIDRTTDEFVCCDVDTGGWEPCDKRERDHVFGDLECNDALNEPEEWELELTGDLPDWSLEGLYEAQYPS